MKSRFKCNICGLSDPRILCFHHTNPTEKEFNLANAIKYSRERVLKELKKCVCLCMNCHAKQHVDIMGNKIPL